LVGGQLDINNPKSVSTPIVTWNFSRLRVGFPREQPFLARHFIGNVNENLQLQRDALDSGPSRGVSCSDTVFEAHGLSHHNV